MTDLIRPFFVDVPSAQLDELARRLDATRWPEREIVDDWSQGTKLDALRTLISYWRDSYDWRRCEARLNGLGQFLTEIDGLDIHFLHVRSPHAGARPLLLTHGWPGSVIEFQHVIGPLTDPVARGGRAEDAFHLVMPSLPGFGFSGKPREAGWGIERTARAWEVLMSRLGYDRWLAQGGDWGSFITRQIAADAPPGCAGAHVNLLIIPPQPGDLDQPGPEAMRALERFQDYEISGGGYSKQLSTRPQSIAYALNDSPAGLAGFIFEKLQSWSAHEGSAMDLLGRDAILDNIMFYWLSGAAGTAGRLYWESRSGPSNDPIALPFGVSQFAGDIFYAPRQWAERHLINIIHWNELPTGGHFAAWEQPAIFVEELRACFADMRF